MSGRQLLLDLEDGPRLGRADFLPAASNAAALAAIDTWRDWPALRGLICGPAGSGRTHLAAIWAAEAGARRLAGAELRSIEPPPGAVVVDDADAAAGDAWGEEALFHLLNRPAGATPLLMTARGTPGTWGLALPDLESRLLAVPVTHLRAPDDALMTMALVKLCDDRQLAVDDATIAYLRTRIDRSLAAARVVVDALDRAAVTRRRRVTRALAGDVLAALDAGDDSHQS